MKVAGGRPRPATAICRLLHQICIWLLCDVFLGPLRFLPCLSAGQRCNETIGNGTRLAAEWMAAPVDSVEGASCQTDGV